MGRTRGVVAAVILTAAVVIAPGAVAASPAQRLAPAQEGSCHPAYSPCLPVVDDLNCSDLAESQKPVTILDIKIDPYQLDNDWTTATQRDGIACEDPIPTTTTTTTTTTTVAPTTTIAPPTTSPPTTTASPTTTTTAAPVQSGVPLPRTGADILAFVVVGIVLINAGSLLASFGRPLGDDAER